jgi:hypothetical protein
VAAEIKEKCPFCNGSGEFFTGWSSSCCYYCDKGYVGNSLFVIERCEYLESDWDNPSGWHSTVVSDPVDAVVLKELTARPEYNTPVEQKKKMQNCTVEPTDRMVHFQHRCVRRN